MSFENKIISSEQAATGKINKLIIKWYYDLHGQIIQEDDEIHEYDQQKFEILNQTKQLMDNNDQTVIDEYDDIILKVGDETYWIDSWQWHKPTNTLLVEACSGAG